MHIKADTLDDLLYAVISRLLRSNNRIRPARGDATELIGVLLQLTNPRARLSLTETKGRLSSCLGELFWYLAKTRDLEFIAYYLPRYRKETEDDRTIYGAYGPRLFHMRGNNQVTNVIKLLKGHRYSRRAVIQIFDAADIARRHKDIPCTCTLQFMVRRRRLHMFTNMRSNDAFIGLPHDVFAFTMLQELVARTLGVELGEYRHAVGSLHLYRRDRSKARQYLREGWQSTRPMPRMPPADPWASVRRVLNAERAIRYGRRIKIRNLHPYWSDLVCLLQIYRHFKDRKSVAIKQLKEQMSTRLYDSYIEDLANRLRRKRTIKSATA